MNGNFNIILFGCGIIGYSALNFLGNNNVQCFCDNNPRLAGAKKYGKDIISFEDLKQNHIDSIVVISVADDRVAHEIAKQCEDNEILDYLFYKTMRESFSNREQLLNYIDSPMNRMKMRREKYITKICELQGQVDYFKSHADIRHMKAAGGRLREKQLELVQMSAEFFEKINELSIKPILYAGNLLGHVRHDGFIPWDDDMDFALIREEYERLKEYCQLNICTLAEFYEKSKTGNEDDMKELGKYYWYNGSDFISVQKCCPDGSVVRMDFFSLDYYADDYSFSELLSYAEQIHQKLISAGDAEGRIACLEKALLENKKNIVKESNHIYFGIDNMEIRNKYHKGWIPREVVFPLKKVLYEGEYFWVPNNPEVFVEYEYEHIWEFPDDVGRPSHLGIDYE